MMEGTRRIRVFGDPVLRSVCPDVQTIDAGLVQLANDMVDTMYASKGVGVAATQVGVKKRLFVYDDGGGSGAHAIVNPRIVETEGEWEYDEGCLSVPGLFFPIKRPDRVVLEGMDLDGESVRHEVAQLTGRIFQHEVDHLDGRLLLSRLDPEQRKQAMSELRKRNPDS